MTLKMEDLQLALYRAGCHLEKNRNTTHNVGKHPDHAVLDQLNKALPAAVEEVTSYNLIVVSQNDFPDSVWTTEEDADKYIAHRRSLAPKRNHGPVTYWHKSRLPLFRKFI